MTADAAGHGSVLTARVTQVWVGIRVLAPFVSESLFAVKVPGLRLFTGTCAFKFRLWWLFQMMRLERMLRLGSTMQYLPSSHCCSSGSCAFFCILLRNYRPESICQHVAGCRNRREATSVLC